MNRDRWLAVTIIASYVGLCGGLALGIALNAAWPMAFMLPGLYGFLWAAWHGRPEE